ncbi:hypothetical protein [Microbulbifer sp. MCCC 1A16149]|uniref:hypothetical protein n=1 Tax=Microbulbifer sp. MCCC 1A16149 TaxID=3411322 RepID=UPI003D0E9821
MGAFKREDWDTFPFNLHPRQAIERIHGRTPQLFFAHISLLAHRKDNRASAHSFLY